MATNNFKAFALDPNANVMSQADWEALPARLSGFISGPAKSAQVNKAIRQASFIAAALAQYTANKSGLDVLDDGDLNGFIAKMSAAFGKDFQALDATLTALAALNTGANKLPYFTGADTAAQTDLTQVGRDVIGQTTVDNLLAYLGLKTAAKRDVGTAANQIPDMSAFVTAGTTNGYQKLPGGLIVQWGRALIPAGGVFVGYPIPFPSLTYVVLLGAVGATATNITANNYQNNGFNFNASAATVVEQAWMAIGR
ncbi:MULTISPECIES: gp53-like domain-containing protein [Enterobacter cloacae complex]|uniref:gp53-like domain-containing protein n=1 Tax=Enterobacter cloacae complex TaxID=354276 RepID=UPI0019D1990A|nr:MULTISPECIES: phage tail protein [Enterobacter cloacae complex]UBM18172.1 phage tail protein [Enterobacter cloacae complex sp. ECL352]HBK4844332.1 phage tail protein [Enterobacter asburiae]